MSEIKEMMSELSEIEPESPARSAAANSDKKVVEPNITGYKQIDRTLIAGARAVEWTQGKLAYGVRRSIDAALAATHITSRFIAHVTEPPKLKIRYRDWIATIGPVRGKKGTTQVAIYQPQCLFRVEKIIAHDFLIGSEDMGIVGDYQSFSYLEQDKRDAFPKAKRVPANGLVTRMTCSLIGQRLQQPATGVGPLTACFGPNVFGNGTTWDTCQPALSIAVSILFLEDAEWEAALFGKAVL